MTRAKFWILSIQILVLGLDSHGLSLAVCALLFLTQG